MELIKIKKHKVNMDVYFVELFQELIVLNNDYGGISVLDHNFKLLKEIKIMDNMLIYSSYKNVVTNELVLYCSDNNSLVYIDLNKFICKKLVVHTELHNFSKYYYWKEKEIVFVTYDGDFFKYNTEKNTLLSENISKIKMEYFEFYQIWVRTRGLPLITYNMNNFEIVYKGKRNNRYYFFNANSDEKFITSSVKPHDVVLYNGLVVLVQEEVISINFQEQRLLLNNVDNTVFARCKVLKSEDDFMILVLSSHNSEIQSELTCYKLKVEDKV
ncbi:hypothetical protein P9597_29695 [Aneurinibacillus migulanus]|uniref:hypothetical protein n=1 Tax=Aneurinibacillus migulanus TaxID=47500 RepID=UPI002E24862D|nr:hypothetical protein [Aneurinibacillus migulanus]